MTACPGDATGTPLSKPAASSAPREFERRLLLDTYRTFGCDDGQPTFRYSLLDGVKDGFLVNPIVVDARSEVTIENCKKCSCPSARSHRAQYSAKKRTMIG